MGNLIVIQFTTLDGVVEDPDGSDGTPFGGWAMRYGRQAIAGDKFRLGGMMETGTLLFGRRTWEHFSTLWPSRDDPFALAMNNADKAVVSHGFVDVTRWSNSRVVDAPLLEWVEREVTGRDVVVIGSGSVVATLAAHDRVDEYRLLFFPTATGDGRRLFGETTKLSLVSTIPSGPGVLAVLTTRTSAASAGG
jgi:dihydrofolate reductase